MAETPDYLEAASIVRLSKRNGRARSCRLVETTLFFMRFPHLLLRLLLLLSRGLTIGALIKSIRTQLGMPQKAVAQRAGVPQSTISCIEQQERDANLATLNKILAAISCDLVIVPLLQDSIEAIRRKQAKKMAEKQVRYLKGTMKSDNLKKS